MKQLTSSSARGVRLCLKKVPIGLPFLNSFVEADGGGCALELTDCCVWTAILTLLFGIIGNFVIGFKSPLATA